MKCGKMRCGDIRRCGGPHDRPEYTVTWMNYDGTILEVDDAVKSGTTPEYNGETPQKPASIQYTFKFSGWRPTPTPIHGDNTYIAEYSQTLNSLRNLVFSLGRRFIPRPQTRGNTKAGDEIYIDTVRLFTDNETSEDYVELEIRTDTLTGEVTHTVTPHGFFTTSENGEKVDEFLGGRSSEELSGYFGGIPEGGTAEMGELYTKLNTYYKNPIPRNLTALTNSWDELEDEGYSLTWSFTASFLDDDGTVLQSSLVEEGETPVYTGTTPSKEGYTFEGWTPTPEAIHSDMEYYATYEPIIPQAYTSIEAEEDSVSGYIGDQVNILLHASPENANDTLSFSIGGNNVECEREETGVPGDYMLVVHLVEEGAGNILVASFNNPNEAYVMISTNVEELVVEYDVTVNAMSPEGEPTLIVDGDEYGSSWIGTFNEGTEWSLNGDTLTIGETNIVFSCAGQVIEYIDKDGTQISDGDSGTIDGSNTFNAVFTVPEPEYVSAQLVAEGGTGEEMIYVDGNPVGNPYSLSVHEGSTRSISQQTITIEDTFMGIIDTYEADGGGGAFLGWNLNSTDLSDGDYGIINNGDIFMATFDATEYCSLDFFSEPAEGGSFSVDHLDVPVGSELYYRRSGRLEIDGNVVTFSANPDYELISLTLGDGTDLEIRNRYTISNEFETVYANYERIVPEEIYLTYEAYPAEGGGIYSYGTPVEGISLPYSTIMTVSGNNIIYQTSETADAISNPGYTFVGWSTSLLGELSDGEYELTENDTLYATFEEYTPTGPDATSIPYMPYVYMRPSPCNPGDSEGLVVNPTNGTLNNATVDIVYDMQQQLGDEPAVVDFFKQQGDDEGAYRLRVCSNYTDYGWFTLTLDNGTEYTVYYFLPEYGNDTLDYDLYGNIYLTQQPDPEDEYDFGTATGTMYFIYNGAVYAGTIEFKDDQFESGNYYIDWRDVHQVSFDGDSEILDLYEQSAVPYSNNNIFFSLFYLTCHYGGSEEEGWYSVFNTSFNTMLDISDFMTRSMRAAISGTEITNQFRDVEFYTVYDSSTYTYTAYIGNLQYRTNRFREYDYMLVYDGSSLTFTKKSTGETGTITIDENEINDGTYQILFRQWQNSQGDPATTRYYLTSRIINYFYSQISQQ